MRSSCGTFERGRRAGRKRQRLVAIAGNGQHNAAGALPLVGGELEGIGAYRMLAHAARSSRYFSTTSRATAECAGSEVIQELVLRLVEDDLQAITVERAAGRGTRGHSRICRTSPRFAHRLHANQLVLDQVIVRRRDFGSIRRLMEYT